MRDLQDKVAVVTGGDSGIGLGITRALIDAGMRVAITYLTRSHLEDAIRTLGGVSDRVYPICLDVSERSEVSAAADEVIRVFGKVHVLVNNAGVLTTVPLSNASPDDWDWCMRVNVDGVFNCLHAFLPHIKSQGEGHVVTTSSMQAGLFVGPYWGLYSTSKFAVVGMMEALRSELSQANIGVSVFCPALVRSRIGLSYRNRPTSLSKSGTPDDSTIALVETFNSELERVMKCETDWDLDPAAAGQAVLEGIRNNDLYIILNPEYERQIRLRCQALLASIPDSQPAASQGRLAMAEIFDAHVYAEELNRRMRSAARLPS